MSKAIVNLSDFSFYMPARSAFCNRGWALLMHLKNAMPLAIHARACNSLSCPNCGRKLTETLLDHLQTVLEDGETYYISRWSFADASERGKIQAHIRYRADHWGIRTFRFCVGKPRVPYLVALSDHPLSDEAIAYDAVGAVVQLAEDMAVPGLHEWPRGHAPWIAEKPTKKSGESEWSWVGNHRLKKQLLVVWHVQALKYAECYGEFPTGQELEHADELRDWVRGNLNKDYLAAKKVVETLDITYVKQQQKTSPVGEGKVIQGPWAG